MKQNEVCFRKGKTTPLKTDSQGGRDLKMANREWKEESKLALCTPSSMSCAVEMKIIRKSRVVRKGEEMPKEIS